MLSHSTMNDTFGKIRNSFGLLTKDFSRLEIHKFLEFLEGEKINTIAKEIGVPRTILYQKNFILKDEVQERLIALVIAADFSYELFADYEKARLWIMVPNEYFFGKTPFQAIMRNQSESVINLLKKWLGKVEGQAY
jgi:hypothetical protein